MGHGDNWSPIVDGWSLKYLLRGIVAYHEAKASEKDPERAFWEHGAMRFKESLLPKAFLEYPDLASSALAVVELDEAYRTYRCATPFLRSIKQEPWTPQRVEEWRAERATAVARYDLLRMMIDCEDRGLEIRSPELDLVNQAN